MAHNPVQRAARSLFTRILDLAHPVAYRGMGMITGIGIAYRAPIGTHPLTGKRAPDLSLAGDTRLYETLREARFVLITPTGETPETGNQVIRAHWTGNRRTALLIRPDGYIAWATEERALARRANALRTALAHWTGTLA
jgi:hypothetical protein